MDELDWIRAGLRAPGKTRRGLAKAMGVPDSAIHSLLGAAKPRSEQPLINRPKPRQLKAVEIERIAHYLEVEPPAFHKRKSVPILTVLTGSSATVSIRPDDKNAGSEIELPPGDLGSTAALIVRGGRMRDLIAGDWVIYFGDRRETGIEDLENTICVMCCDDGLLVVGAFESSRYEGRYDLRDFFGGEPQIARVIDWVAPVLNIVPPMVSSQTADLAVDDRKPEILKIRKPS